MEKKEEKLVVFWVAVEETVVVRELGGVHGSRALDR